MNNMEYLPSIPESTEIEFLYDVRSFLSEKPRTNRAKKIWAKKEIHNQIKMIEKLLEEHFGIKH